MADELPQRPPCAGYPVDANPVLDAICAHRSIRNFAPEPVSEAQLDAIVEAAQRAPTSSNLQSYSIIVVDDKRVRERLREAAGGQRFMVECGALLVFCADISRLVRISDERGYPFRRHQLNMLLVAHGDAVLAGQNAALAAESLGFGTCMLGIVRRRPEAVSPVLGLPRHVFATVGLAIGVPAEVPGLRPRLPRKAVVSRDAYSTEHLAEGLAEYDRITRCAGMYRGQLVSLAGVAPDRTETFDDESYGWVEDTARRLADPGETRPGAFAAYLESIGFTCR